MPLVLLGLVQKNLEEKNNDNYVSNKINYSEKQLAPSYLDKEYKYLLANGFYNYQEYINYQASKAQEGDSKALESCLYYFGWRSEGLPTEILGEYYFTLISGGVDIYQTDKLSFIRLFSTKAERKILEGKRPSRVKGNLASKKITEISNHLLSIKTKKEILNDLIDLLIDRILKYKPGSRTLRKYIYDIYYLYVADYVQRTFKHKEYIEGPFKKTSYKEDYSNSLDSYKKIELESTDFYYEWEKEKNMLGVFWVMGHTHPYFEDLTKIERLILRENMYLNNSQESIAEKLGIGRTTVRTNLNNAKKKIKKSISETSIEWIESNGYENFKQRKERT